ncbi:MAG: leucine-rich repeat domain-containing protein [Clostridia bacterium]|nr:leucine-rich repeat domain-containing protein [Clostridia bacterium]
MNNFKKYLALFLALAMILPLVPVFEIPVYSATSGIFTYTVNEEDEYSTITGINDKTVTEVTIPETLGDYSVKAIKGSAFADCTSLQSVTISDTVESLGNNVFKGCTALTSVTFGVKVNFIGSNAFYGCTSLSEVNVAEGNTSFKVDADAGCILEKYGKDEDFGLLYCCFKRGSTLTVPTGVRRIRAFAFSGHTDLETVVISKDVIEIAEKAFNDCPALDTFEVAEGNSTFSAEESGYLLKGTTLVVGTNSGNPIPENVTAIGNNAFLGRAGITEMTIPASVKEIGTHAFSDCTELSSLTIANNSNLAIVGTGAFAGCAKLDSIQFPATVIEIGRGAFVGCGLQTLSVNEGNAVYLSKDNCILSNDEKTVLFGCNGSVIPETVTAIGDYAFDGCTTMTSMIIPSGVTSIGDFAFAGCTSLANVVIPDSVTEIGTRAFFGCTSLNTIALPKQNVQLGSHLFGLCASLTSVTLPEDIKKIDPWTFAYCTGLETIVIPSGVTSIGEAAFLHCTALTEIFLPAGIERIEYGAFDHCLKLSDVWFSGDVPEFVNTAENDEYIKAKKHCLNGHNYDNSCDSFCNSCDSPRAVIHTYSANCDTKCDLCDSDRTAPVKHSYRTDTENSTVVCDVCKDEIPYAGATGECFYRLEGTDLIIFGEGSMGNDTPWGKDITSVIIMEGVKKISSRAFENCESLVSAVIPSSVTIVGDWAFAGCDALTDVTFLGKPALLGSNAFYNCKSLQNIWFKGNEDQLETFPGRDKNFVVSGSGSVICSAPLKKSLPELAIDATVVDGLYEATFPEEDMNLVVSGSGSVICSAPLKKVLPELAIDATVVDGLHEATWNCISIIARSFSLHSSINANIYAEIDSPEKAANSMMRFTMNGKETTVKATLDSGSTYKFVFEGIAPQCMGDTIQAELIVDGMVWDIESFSLRTYCDDIFTMSAKELGYTTTAPHEALKTMIVDLLNYGAMAQKYQNYKTDALVNDGIAAADIAMESLAEWENPLSSEDWDKVLSESDGTAWFKGANVWFDNENRLYIKFAVAADIAKTNLFVRIHDTTANEYKDYVAPQFDDLSNDVYAVFSEPISVCDFSHKFEITLYSVGIDENGQRVETIHHVLSKYGINSYIYSMQNKLDAEGKLSNMALLARACYCYGVSASEFQSLI